MTQENVHTIHLGSVTSDVYWVRNYIPYSLRKTKLVVRTNITRTDVNKPLLNIHLFGTPFPTAIPLIFVQLGLQRQNSGFRSTNPFSYIRTLSLGHSEVLGSFRILASVNLGSSEGWPSLTALNTTLVSNNKDFRYHIAPHRVQSLSSQSFYPKTTF